MVTEVAQHGRQGERPHVVAVIGSPRPNGNTTYTVRTACDELARRGVATQVIHLSRHRIRPCAGHDDCGLADRCHLRDDAEELLATMYGADGVILASPTYFSNMSGQMKVFLDRANDRYLRKEWLPARAVGLITVGGQGGLDDTLAALRRVLQHLAPSGPPVFTAAGIADKLGDAERSEEVRRGALALAAQLASALL